MPDNLAIIDMVIEAHHTIRGHIKLVGDTINDLEAVFASQKVFSTWTQSATESLVENQKKLQQTMSLLEEGLKNHFAFEEEVLPPLFGETLMQALILEHREISKELDKARLMVADARLEGLSHQELLGQKSQIQKTIGGICQMIEEHATREEIIFRMLRRTLEQGPRKELE